MNDHDWVHQEAARIQAAHPLLTPKQAHDQAWAKRKGNYVPYTKNKNKSLLNLKKAPKLVATTIVTTPVDLKNPRRKVAETSRETLTMRKQGDGQ